MHLELTPFSCTDERCTFCRKRQTVQNDKLTRILDSEVYPALASGPPIGVKPEAWTLEKIIDPILTELGYLRQYREPEFRPGRDTVVWVDRLLKDSNRDPAIFLEAKSLLEADIWNRHKSQVYSYINVYRLSPGADEVKTVRWSVLTNGIEWYFVSNLDRRPEPFQRITLTRDSQKDTEALSIFARDNLGALLANYNESRNIPLGVQFVKDLRSWRQHLANELVATDPRLSDTEVADFSQHVIDQLIFVRVLETTGLQPSFGLLKLFTMYDSVFKNRVAVPFGGILAALLKDLEADLNTELLKLIPETVGRLTHDTFRPIIVPDSAIPGSALIQNSLYNYDFRDLTFDILGEVYEQYLGHELRRQGNVITLTSSRRQQGAQGAYYTPAPVVSFTTALGLRHLTDAADVATLASNAKKARVVDISCGSGAFLLAAFRLLVKERSRYEALAYVPDQFAKNQAQIGFPAPRELIAEHLFGIDKDNDAVEVARLNLWLELIKTTPLSLKRSANGTEQLPHLGQHVFAADTLQDNALDRYFDILGRLNISQNDNVIVLGNPPWGADLSSYDNLSAKYQTFAGVPPESAALFIERIVEALPDGCFSSLVLPDSLLMRTQYAVVRSLLVEQCQILDIVRLGEGFFIGVSRAAIVICFRKGKASETSFCRAYIFSKKDRIAASSSAGHNLINVYEQNHWTIRQSHLRDDARVSWDIFVDDADRLIFSRIGAEHDTVGDLLVERGVELSQDGRAITCADCGATVPTARRPKAAWDKNCDNCKRKLRETSRVVHLLNPDHGETRPFIVGKDMHRLTVRRRETISIAGTKSVPVCPNCGYADATLGLGLKHQQCIACSSIFTIADAKVKAVGIKYKDPSLYAGRKVLLRQTGRGLYAALDDNSYCSQTVYVLRGERRGFDSAFLAGVLSSRFMLYVYYKRMGVIEWQSYPHLTMEFVQRLPFPRLDLTRAEDALIHDQIVEETLALTRTPERPALKRDDSILETLVRRSFGLSGDEGEHVDRALSYIASLGPLLGEVDDPDAADLV